MSGADAGSGGSANSGEGRRGGRLSWIGIVCAVLVAFGLSAGVRSQLGGGEPAMAHNSADSRSGGRQVLQIDLHAHTRFSDGFLSPMELVLLAKRQGLDAVAVTEHNMVFPAKLAAWFSRLVGGPIVLVGQEITTRDYHLIAVGLKRRVVPQRDVRAVIREVHQQGGIAIAAHPVRRYWPAFDAVRDELDAAEVVHPAAFGGVEAFRWEEMVAFFERSDAKPLTAVGSSDFHFFRTLGICRTEVFVDERSEAAILRALRDGETRVRAPDGRRFGRLRTPSAEDKNEPPPAYQPRDGWDAVMRAGGWLGVLGLLLFRVRRPSAA